VGPVWSGGHRGEPETLANCYRNSLSLASENCLRTIAFPAISCGVYRYPIPDAARIAVETTSEFLRENASITEVTFVVSSSEIEAAYQHVLGEA
jgi:O-acetyl-ADP-ribose deacetylase (regulator of RNase III)